jgi:hypothetical protein
MRNEQLPLDESKRIHTSRFVAATFPYHSPEPFTASSKERSDEGSAPKFRD